MKIKTNKRVFVVVLAGLIALSSFAYFGYAKPVQQSKDFWVYGKVGNEDGGTPETANIGITNERTNETLYQFSTDGKYKRNLADLPSGYKIHDTIIVDAWQYEGNGKINYDKEKFEIPSNGDFKIVDLIIVPIPKPLEIAPTPMLLSTPVSPDPPLPSTSKDGLESESGGSGGGSALLSDTVISTCSDPPETWEDMVIEMSNNLIIESTGCLRLNHTTLKIKSDQFNTYKIEIKRDGAQYGYLEVWNTPSGQSEITAYYENYGYYFYVNGSLHVNNSLVNSMRGTPSIGGIQFGTDSIGLIEEYSNISNGDSFGIHAVGAQDLTIKNSTITLNGEITSARDGIGIHLDDSIAEIKNNTITQHERHGIEVSSSSSSILIQGNNITDNREYGIRLSSSSNVDIIFNNISSSSYGVGQFYGTNIDIKSNNVTQINGIGLYFYGNAGAYVYNNSIYSNYFGIDVRYTPWVTVESNDVYDNNVGIGVRSRYTSVTFDKPIIKWNNVTENDKGIYIYPHQSDVGGNIVGATPWIMGNLVEDNEIGIQSVDSGPKIEYNYVQYNDYGIGIDGFFDDTYFSVTRQPIIENYNYIQMNEYWGINVSSSLPSISLNNIYGNEDGIIVWNSAPTIENNSIGLNTNRGVYIYYLYSPGNRPVLRNNDISSNSKVGIYVDTSGPIIESTAPYTQYIVDSEYTIVLSYASIDTLIKNNFIGGLLMGEPPQPSIPQIGIYHARHSHPTMDNNYIQKVYFAGISIVNYSDPIAKNNTIKTLRPTSVGIFAGDNTAPQIGTKDGGNNITGRFASVYTTNATAKIENNTLWGYPSVNLVHYGILEFCATPDEISDPLILGNDILYNDIGIGEYGIVNNSTHQITPSTSIIKDNIITDNFDDGILSVFSTPTIGGSGMYDKNTIEDNGGWGIHSQYAKPTNSGSLGVTLLAHNTIGINTNGKILQEWRVKVKVLYDGFPQAGASVTVYECTNPPTCTNWIQYPTGTYITDGTGITEWITVREYFIDNANQQFDCGYHKFMAVYGLLDGETQTQVRDNKPNASDPNPIIVNIS